MTILSKICNHPELLLPPKSSSLNGFQEFVLNVLNDSSFVRGDYDPLLSGKMVVLEQLLDSISRFTKDKVVIASSFTKTLDIIQKVFVHLKFVRLDGSTEMSQRQYAIDSFQKDPSCFAFLLSTKAGAVGLNLFAANRLILFDGEWNPSFDHQAQARIWRDGQTKTTYVYRLLSTGMIDEKIFQRQLAKTELSRTVVDVQKEYGSSFTKEELKDRKSVV